MMVALTRDAQGYLDRYIRQLNATLRGHRSVDATDVERDVLGHIEAELAGVEQPVSAASLRLVLEQLGSPSQWVPPDDLPLWRRVLSRLRSGPEDWRLAYLTCFLFFGGPVLGNVREGWEGLGAMTLLVSIVLARATLAVLAEHDEPVGARAWLIYPPLVLFYLALAIGLVVGPTPLPVVALEDPQNRAVLEGWLVQPFWFGVTLLAVIGAGVWWMILGLVAARFQHAVRVVFSPFADWWESRHGLRLALAGVVLFVLAVAVLQFSR